jgi:hypothetical protein
MLKRVLIISGLAIAFIMAVVLYQSLQVNKQEVEGLNYIQAEYIHQELVIKLQRDIRFYLLQQDELMLSGITARLSLFGTLLDRLYEGGVVRVVAYQPKDWESSIRSLFVTPGNIEELNRMLGDFDKEITELFIQSINQEEERLYDPFFQLHESFNTIFQSYDDEIYSKLSN